MLQRYSAEGAKPGVIYIEESNSNINCLYNALKGFYFGDCIIKKGLGILGGNKKVTKNSTRGG